MRIYLDFDGTVVEHEYPKIGRHNFGCMPVIKKLQDAGHEIILNTYRSDCNDGTLEEAVKYLNEDSFMFFDGDGESSLKDITNILSNKIHPPAWNWTDIIENNRMFIDDIANGIPLKKCCMVKNSFVVDWNELDKQFIVNGIYGD